MNILGAAPPVVNINDYLQEVDNAAELELEAFEAKGMSMEKKFTYSKVEKAFFHFNNNTSSINFIPESDAEHYEDAFYDLLAKYSKNKKLLKRDGAERYRFKNSAIQKGDKGAVAFLNPKIGLEVIPGLCSAFPGPDNPFFDEDKVKHHVMNVLTEPEVSPQLASFCLRTYYDKLTFIHEPVMRPFIENFDFYMRYWKKDDYHLKPLLKK